MNISCLIIDDEPASQTILKKFISNVDFLELKGICNNAIEALEFLKEFNSVDLLFLDINMPKISGLTFYKSLQNSPQVIFTTAYSHFAIDGFDVNAVDFLLKPFSFDRFYIAVNKVIEKLQTNSIKTEDHYLLIKSNKITHKIASNDILYVEAFGDYVKIHLENKYILTNNTFTNILELLPTHIFIRTHKSFAVNLIRINTINGNQIAINNHLIPIGQKFKSSFFKILNKD